MQEATGYHLKLMELSTEIVSHGFGEGGWRATTLKDGVVKLEIMCGKHYVFFIKKEIKFNNDNII